MSAAIEYWFFNIKNYFDYSTIIEDFSVDDVMLYRTKINIGYNGRSHSRYGYSFTSLLGDIGGFYGAVIGIFACVVGPFS